MDLTITTDSGTKHVSNGYWRQAVVVVGEAGQPTQYLMVTVLVDRSPTRSFAQVEAFDDDDGWTPITFLHPNAWWSDMPGFQRSTSDEVGRCFRRLAERLVTAALNDYE